MNHEEKSGFNTKEAGGKPILRSDVHCYRERQQIYCAKHHTHTFEEFKAGRKAGGTLEGGNLPPGLQIAHSRGRRGG